MWRKYFTVGNLKVIEYDREKQHSISRIEDFDVHPIQCQVLLGYFSTISQMITGGKVVGKETKCIYRGDKYHEFLFEAR